MNKQRINKMINNTVKILYFLSISWFGIAFFLINPIVGILIIVVGISAYFGVKKLKKKFKYKVGSNDSNI